MPRPKRADEANVATDDGWYHLSRLWVVPSVPLLIVVVDVTWADDEQGSLGTGHETGHTGDRALEDGR